MRKLTALCMGILFVCFCVASNVYAGGIASTLGKALVGGVAGDVMDGAGRVVGAGADWAQESINGNQYNTYIQGDLESKSDSTVQKVETGQDAIVSVGSVTLNHSRFNSDVDLETINTVGSIRAEDNSLVDVGSISFSRTRVNGDTEIEINNRVPGGLRAGKGSVVRIGDFKSF